MSDMTVSDDLLREVVESVSGGDASVRNLLGLMMARELIKLRDQLRWRKWPEEKPVNSGRYLVLTDGSTDIGNHLSYWSRTVESWSTKDAGIAFWRPIGPLPGGE